MLKVLRRQSWQDSDWLDVCEEGEQGGQKQAD